MPSLTFDYLPEPVADPKTGKIIGTIYRPKVPIRLCYGHKLNTFIVDCLADSGSDFNIFPAAWGETVGIKIKKGIYKEIYGIGGVKIDSYAHRVKLYIENNVFTAETYFSYEQNTPLLGREGFFNCFKEVAFLQSQRKIKLILKT